MQVERIRFNKKGWIKHPFGVTVRTNCNLQHSRIMRFSSGDEEGRGRPRKYSGVVIRLDITHLQLTEDMGLDRRVWRLQVRVEV